MQGFFGIFWYNDGMKLAFLVGMFILGAILGSFVCCQAWRMRYREEGKKDLGRWSVCLACGKRLEWFENLPVISWLVLRGKCRKCGAKIGLMEILSEVGLGVVFVLMGRYYWPSISGMEFSISMETLVVILKMVVVFVTITGMWLLAIYDGKWGRLPISTLTFVNVCAIIYLILRIVGRSFGGARVDFLGVIMAVGILAGIYYLLYFFSHEKWVGSGDWLVGLAIGLILGDWFLALVVLFVANFLASIFGIFAIAKEGRKARISFGPFLVLAFVMTFIMQDSLLALLG